MNNITRVLTQVIYLLLDGGLIKSEDGLVAGFSRSLAFRFFSSSTRLHIACRALVTDLPETCPWQRNMWHLCFCVVWSRAIYAKSLQKNENKKNKDIKVLTSLKREAGYFFKVSSQPLYLWTRFQRQNKFLVCNGKRLCSVYKCNRCT